MASYDLACQYALRLSRDTKRHVRIFASRKTKCTCSASLDRHENFNGYEWYARTCGSSLHPTRKS